MAGICLFDEIISNALTVISESLFEEQFEVLVQGRLVGFDLQQIVASAVEDTLGGGLLAMHGVSRDYRPPKSAVAAASAVR